MRSRRFLRSTLEPRERWRECFGWSNLLKLSTCSIIDPICNASSDNYTERNQMLEFNPAMRHALLRRLCSPEHPLPAKCIYKQLVNPCHLVKEFDFSKSSKRLGRQHAVLRFLRKHNVLMHSLLFYIPETTTWNRTGEFDRLALYGKRILSSEVRGRLLHLFPDMPPLAFAKCAKTIISDDSLADLFDILHMELIVGLRPPTKVDSKPPSPEQGSRVKRLKIRLNKSKKVHMLCAIVGEMQWFVARTKATDRTHNNALFPPSDVLILHVLCVHLLECIPAEVIFRDLESHLRAIRPVWVNAPMSLPTQYRLIPRTLGSLALSSEPHLPTTEELDRRAKASAAIESIASANEGNGKGAVVGVRPLTTQPDANYVKSFMRPKCLYTRFETHWYKILQTDRKGEAPCLNSEKTTRVADAGVTFSQKNS
ncbi:unnamed protein product [Phytomonas sp. Hart1]|nr:unnamed protein product [Phytomonas sp. Hart1]|eukprot:CCW71136.1 unnamed protein product [Phytomonas sp. isolate Hart1]